MLSTNNKIKAIQIDVNGFCNAGCWYCPVSYLGNPKSSILDMPLDTLENILSQLNAGKSDFVDENLSLIFTAHYNEVLLYKNLKEMLELYKKYNFKINILSNGVALTKDKVDLLNEYKDIINEVLLNIPSANPELWASYVNMNKGLFKKVVDNVLYAKETLTGFAENYKLRIMVNGLNNKSILDNGGWVEILNNAPKLDLDINNGSLAKEVSDLTVLFPGITVFENYHLYDRAGHLEDLKIIGQSKAINKYLDSNNKKVVGCSGGLFVRDRTKDWLHINPNGDMFMCCDDFSFETIYENINNKTLKEIWLGQNRKDMIDKARETICKRCSAAIWE